MFKETKKKKKTLGKYWLKFYVTVKRNLLKIFQEFPTFHESVRKFLRYLNFF